MTNAQAAKLAASWRRFAEECERKANNHAVANRVRDEDYQRGRADVWRAAAEQLEAAQGFRS